MIAAAASFTLADNSVSAGVSSSAFLVYSWMLCLDASAAAPDHACAIEF
ncbi:hypothetical protein [Nocardia farcinica]|nr:hypothetical protein [Nocardia farcinica]